MYAKTKVLKKKKKNNTPPLCELGGEVSKKHFLINR